MPAASQLVSLERVSRVFDRGAVVALRDVDLAVPAEQSLAIVGASGSGKTSLINLMSGIDQPSSGRVHWSGAPVTSRRQWAALRSREIGIVFQEFHLIPTLTAIENVELALFGHGLAADARRQRAAAALERVGLAGRLDHLPHALSGGERQRVAIARSIVNEPKLLLADEPTGNLDSVNATMVADLLISLQAAARASLVIVTHDESLARRCRRQVHIRDGRIVDDRMALGSTAGGAP